MLKLLLMATVLGISTAQYWGAQPNPSYPTSGQGSYPSTGIESYPSSYSNSQPNLYPNSQSNLYPNSPPNVDPNSQPNAYPNSQPNVYPNSEPNTYPNLQSNAYPNSKPNAYPNSKPNAYPNSQPKPPNYNNSYSRPTSGGYRPPYSPPLTSEVYISPVTHSRSISPPHTNPYNTRGGPTYSTHTSQTFVASIHP